VRDVIKVLRMIRTALVIVVTRRYPASVRQPLIMPIKKRRKTAIEPTYAIRNRFERC
jgi:hypothetical protein